jgi:O-acetyl-ADP-ribose deacetylase (regulator of RNase III)
LTELEVQEGDITALEVDAIANAANNHLWMGTGVAGAIKRAGGEEIEHEAVQKGPIEIGDAVATAGGVRQDHGRGRAYTRFVVPEAGRVRGLRRRGEGRVRKDSRLRRVRSPQCSAKS